MSDWHILVKTRSGVVTLLKNLSEDASRQSMRRLTRPMDRPGYDEENGEDHWKHKEDSDVVQLEAFGPEGQELDVWCLPKSGAA